MMRYEDWIGERSVPMPGNNVESKTLPFQSWRPFKEAFAPEIVHRAIQETQGTVSHLLDPFGGSGTAALVAQFMGIKATTIEVNPFLADLIRSKLETYDTAVIIRNYSRVLDKAYCTASVSKPYFAGAPDTFVEPGVDDRYIFGEAAAAQISRLLQAIDSLDDTRSSRLFRILLATTAVELSNIVISGKGRRYRKSWQDNIADSDDITELFSSKVLSAIEDISHFGNRATASSVVVNADARTAMTDVAEIDVAVFSPPYPNSFDYTDVYNVELWLLGYLTSSADNRALRQKTLRSHVQIKRDFAYRKLKSRTLQRTLDELVAVEDQLWNRHIPAMVGAYFDDMFEILTQLGRALRSRGRAYCIVGDSKYAAVSVPVAKILTQLSRSTSLKHVHSEKFRSMRSSPQQGGREELPETLLVFEKH